jgi:hypothetical protein
VAAVQHQSCLDRAALARGPAARHVPHDTETGRPEVAGQIAGQDRLLRLEHADHGQRLRPTCCRRWRGGRAVSGRGHPPEGHGLAVALRARVRRDRLLAFACRRAVGRDLHPQRRWEALPAMTCAPRRPAAKAQPLRIYVLANLPSVPAWDEIIADLPIWIGVRRRRICATYMLLGRCSADLFSLNILYNKDKFLKCGNVPIPPRSRGGKRKVRSLP